jgi:hypothetical protein
VLLCEDVRRTTSFEAVPVLKRLSNLAFLLHGSPTDGGGGDDWGGGDDRGSGDDRAETTESTSHDDITELARNRLRWTM